MAKDKKAKKAKKNQANEVVELADHERLIEVVLHFQVEQPIEEAAVLIRDQTILEVQAFGETKVVRFGDCSLPAEGEEEGGEVAGKFSGAVLEKRLALDFNTLNELRGIGVCLGTLFAPPVPEPSATPTPELNTAAPRGKGQAAAGRKGGSRSVSPARDRRKSAPAIDGPRGDAVASTPMSLLDILSTTSHMYPLDLSAPIAGLASCSLELRCRDRCIGPEEVLGKFRPACVTVHSMDSVVPAVEGPIYAEIEIAGRVIKTKNLMEKSLHPFLFRDVALLGDGNPLDLYHRVLLSPVVVSVFGGDGDSSRPLGSGTFSISSMATDRQTRVHELVQLLPGRASAASDDNCLTAACNMTVSVDIFIPLPDPIHVMDTGDVVAKQFLTRGVVAMPYMAPWSKDVLSCLLRELLESDKADPQRQVSLYAEVPQPVVNEEEEVPFAKAGNGKGKAAKAPKAKSKAPKGKNRPPTPPPPPQPTAFDQPFKVISPEGISGFEISDGEYRIICLEGPVHEVHRIFTDLNKAARGDPAMKLLLNSELFVPLRSYCTYPPLVTPPPKKVKEVETPALPTKPPKNSGSSGKKKTSKSATPAPEPVVTPTPAPEEEVEDMDETGGGCGGRIHRIRLRETLRSLMSQQRFLIRRTLSEECVSCFQKLYALTQCTALRDALGRDLFPTASSIISLERSFGGTLELVDIFGSDEFVRIAPKDSTVGSTVEQPSVSSPLDVDVGSLSVGDVGQLVSFTGLIQQGPLEPIPKAVLARYGCVMRMVTDEGKRVMCVFPKAHPTGTIRYEVAGQVVRCGDELLLYALDLHTVSASFIDTRNAKFDAVLQERKRRMHQILPHSVAKSTMATSVAVHNRTMYPADNFSDSNSDDDDAKCPPLNTDAMGDDDSMAFLPLCAPRKHLPAATRTTTLRAAGTAGHRQTAEDYDELWRLYDARAPKKPSAGLTATAGPPMHFGKTL